MVFVDPQTGEPLPDCTPQHLTNPDGSLNALWATAEGYPMVPPDAAAPKPDGSFDGSKWQKSPLGPMQVTFLKPGIVVSAEGMSDDWKYVTAGLNDDGEMMLTGIDGTPVAVPWGPDVEVNVWTPKEDGPPFNPDDWEPAGQQTGAEAPTGTVVKIGGDYFELLGETPGGGKYLKGLTGPSTGKQGPGDTGMHHGGTSLVNVMKKKADAPAFDYDQMSKGDTVPLDGLMAGDVFEMPELHPGFFMKVLTPSAFDQDAKLEVLAPDGSKFEFDMGPKNAVIFHAHQGAGPDMDPFAATPTPATSHADASPFALATVPNFDPYLHPKGGKKKNDKVLMMAPGTVFKDKSGKLYEIKHAGYATAVVVSDGEQLYKMDGDLRGQVITDQASINAFKSNDQAGSWPPPGEPATTDAPNVAQLKAQMTPNEITLFGLEVGDYFQEGEKVWKLHGKSGISHYVTDVATGGTKTMAGGDMVDAYLKNTPEKYGPDDPDPGDAAHKVDYAGGDVIIDAETGHKMVVVPWQTVIATGKQLDGAPDTHIGFYDWTATEVKVVKAEDLFDQELPGGFHPGDTAKAYTVALGATDVTVIAMRSENLVEKLKVKLPNGDIELLPMSAVTPLETHTPDGEKVRLPDMDTATWNHTETTAIKTPAELKLGQFFDVAAGGNAEVPQYMVTAKKDGKTTLTVLGTGTVGGVPHTYPDDTDISSGWGKSDQDVRAGRAGRDAEHAGGPAGAQDVRGPRRRGRLHVQPGGARGPEVQGAVQEPGGRRGPEPPGRRRARGVAPEQGVRQAADDAEQGRARGDAGGSAVRRGSAARHAGAWRLRGGRLREAPGRPVGQRHRQGPDGRGHRVGAGPARHLRLRPVEPEPPGQRDGRHAVDRGPGQRHRPAERGDAGDADDAGDHAGGEGRRVVRGERRRRSRRRSCGRSSSFSSRAARSATWAGRTRRRRASSRRPARSSSWAARSRAARRHWASSS